jgi:hypothetical protein
MFRGQMGSKTDFFLFFFKKRLHRFIFISETTAYLHAGPPSAS